MFQSPRKAGRASLRRSLLLMFAIFTHVEAILDTTYPSKCTNYSFVSQIMVYTVFTLTRVFLRLLPRVLSLLTEWTLVLFGKS